MNQTPALSINVHYFRCWKVALLLAGALVPSVQARSEEPAANPQIRERMQQFVNDGIASGIVTLVANRDHVLHLDAVGLADIEGQEPMKADSLFAVASMTKPIAAAAVMILQDEGKLSLDDPVAKYLPSFAEVKLKSGERPNTAMTIRHLLTHTSGLGGDQRNMGTLAQTVDELAKRPLDFEPGTRWQYSPSLNVAGRVVEVVAQQSFDQFLAERVFEKLEMEDTSFLPSKDKVARIAKLYKPKPDSTTGKLQITTHWINEISPDRTPNPSGGLFSTARDMARFYQMMLHEGEWNGQRILSQEAVREMTRLQTGDLKTGFTSGNGWGLGFCVVREPQGVTEMLSAGTFGHGGAFGTQSWANPKQGLIFVLLLQRTELPNSDDSDIRKEFQQIAVDAFH